MGADDEEVEPLVAGVEVLVAHAGRDMHSVAHLDVVEAVVKLYLARPPVT